MVNIHHHHHHCQTIMESPPKAIKTKKKSRCNQPCFYEHWTALHWQLLPSTLENRKKCCGSRTKPNDSRNHNWKFPLNIRPGGLNSELPLPHTNQHLKHSFLEIQFASIAEEAGSVLKSLWSKSTIY